MEKYIKYDLTHGGGKSAVIGSYVNYAHYTYTPSPKTAEERHANQMLVALFGWNIVSKLVEAIEEENLPKN